MCSNKSLAGATGKVLWHGSITHEAIAEAVHLPAQALLKHADDFVVAPTTS
jgi:hypothetical protein